MSATLVRTKLPFKEEFVRRCRELAAWANRKDPEGWRRAKKSARLVVCRGPIRIEHAAGGMRGRKTTVLLQSTVNKGGAQVYGHPLHDLVDRRLGLVDVEMFPFLHNRTRPRKADIPRLMKWYFDTAVTSGAIDIALEALRRANPKQNPMDLLAQIIGELPESHGDYWDTVAMYMGTIPYIVANIVRIRSGREPVRTEQIPLSFADWFVDMIETAPNRKLAVKFVNMYMILMSSHSVNLSTKGAQDHASGGGSLRDTIIVALRLLKTKAHGGAQSLIHSQNADLIGFCNLQSGQMPTMDQLVAWVIDRLKRGLAIDGFGHAVLQDLHDYRGVRVFELLDSDRTASEDWQVRLGKLIFDKMPNILKRKEVRAIKKIRNRFTNVDFAAALAQRALLGIEDEAVYVLLFAMARFPDWIVTHSHLNALGLPIARADSVDELWLEERFPKNGEA